MHYRPVAEQNLSFELPDTDGLHINGTLRGDPSVGRLAVMMHGRPGGRYDLLQYLAARTLWDEYSIPNLRLFMYDTEPGTRDNASSTLYDHINDFQVAVENLQSQYPGAEIHAVGHSYGGLTILGSSAEPASAVLWDPTHGSIYPDAPPKNPENDPYPTKFVDGLVIAMAGAGALACSEKARMIDYALGDTTSWAKNKNYPLAVISAGQGVLTDLGRKYVDAANPRLPRLHHVIPEATHNFHDTPKHSDQVLKELFRITAKWILGERGIPAGQTG